MEVQRCRTPRLTLDVAPIGAVVDVNHMGLQAADLTDMNGVTSLTEVIIVHEGENIVMLNFWPQGYDDKEYLRLFARA